MRGGKAVRRSGRGKSVCYNTRVPLRRGLCAIPFRFTLSSEAHRKEVQEERMERGEAEMVVLLFLLGSWLLYRLGMGKIGRCKRAVTFQPPLSDNACGDKNRGQETRSGERGYMIGQGFNWEPISVKFQIKCLSFVFRLQCVPQKGSFS